MFLDFPALRPIREVMLDPQVSEIMINGPDQVYVERNGVMELYPLHFEDDDQLRAVADALLLPSGRSISSATPFMDFRLPDGSRGNVVIPPLALNGTVLTIRKFTKVLTKVTDLIRVNTLNKRMATLLCTAVKVRANIIFAGATGTGKTTTLAILSRFISEHERIITIEDTAELQLHQSHVVRLECRKANLEGKGEVGMAELVRNSLRMRPTRIIVGEIRGSEAVDMIQAIASGHEGCLAVIHASSPEDAVSRLEMMLLSRGLLLPMWAVHRQIASAIDLLVQHEFSTDGTRRITRITQISRVENEEIVLEDLFAFQRTGTDPAGRELGEWRSNGVVPRFLHKCQKMGVALPPETYAAGAE
jgi:pilus assembly protein CpaF